MAWNATGRSRLFVRWARRSASWGAGRAAATCGAIAGDGVSVISTANRNFKDRMGNGSAEIYLASPASCAAAVRGEIADPGEFME